MDDAGETMVTIRRACAAMGIAAALIAGCKNEATKSYDLTVKHDEKWDLPPHAPQYDNPPESAYKKPAPKDTFKPGPGGGGMDPGMAGMGAPGMGGQRR
jgi:hypothetical protein